LVGNAFGLFGAGVYLHEVTAANGWRTSLVSGAVTLFYIVSALLLIPVGIGINRFGPRPVVAFGGIAMAGGVAGVGQAATPWQVYLAFLSMGVAWACLSTTAVATTLAPWFEKYQGRAMSIASLGASAGGMVGAPVLLFGIGRIGFQLTTAIASVFALAVLLPLAGLVLRHRPRDMGLFPDGLPHGRTATEATEPHWTSVSALRTTALRTVMATFGLGMMVQIGFLTHQVTLLAQSLSALSVSMIVSGTAIAALLGRLALARFADQLDVRMTASAVLILAASVLGTMGLFLSPIVLAGGSLVFGLTVGNVTTLSPIIVRQEFGAPAFGAVFGVASCVIQLVTALGPGYYGLLHDIFGSYRGALILAAALHVVAAAIILFDRRNVVAIDDGNQDRRDNSARYLASSGTPTSSSAARKIAPKIAPNRQNCAGVR
jgi:MFS family permease